MFTFVWKNGEQENKLIDSEQWPRFQMAANGSKLKIIGARVDDSGKYFCTADNGFAKLNVSINLLITEGLNNFLDLISI